MLRPPTTKYGRRSFALLGAAVVLWGVMALAVALGVRGDSPLPLEIAFLAVPVVCAFASAIAGGIAAIFAVFHGERSALLLLPALVGAGALFFVIGELAVPH